MPSPIDALHFTDPDKAREHLEAQRWPNGPVCPHCGEKHLHRYLSEFEFRYNQHTALGVSDVERTEAALRGIEGKRLTYRRIDEAAHS